MLKQKWLKDENGEIIFDGGFLEVFIPKRYFEGKNIASIENENLLTLGIFAMRVSDSEENREKGHIFHMAFPMNVLISIWEREDWTGSLEGEDPIQYEIYKFNRGQTFIKSKKFIQTGEVVASVLYIITGNKIPHYIKYSEIINLIKGAIKLNKQGLGVPSNIIELIISGLCRDENNLEIPYRRIIGKETYKGNELDFEMVNIKDLARINSIFGGIAFEDLDRSLASGIVKTQKGTAEVMLPSELTNL